MRLSIGFYICLTIPFVASAQNEIKRNGETPHVIQESVVPVKHHEQVTPVPQETPVIRTAETPIAEPVVSEPPTPAPEILHKPGNKIPVNAVATPVEAVRGEKKESPKK